MDYGRRQHHRPHHDAWPLERALLSAAEALLPAYLWPDRLSFAVMGCCEATRPDMDGFMSGGDLAAQGWQSVDLVCNRPTVIQGLLVTAAGLALGACGRHAARPAAAPWTTQPAATRRN